MNMPFAPVRVAVRTAHLAEPDEALRIEGFVQDLGGSVFHRPAWLAAIERGTGQLAAGLMAERGGDLAGWLPLTVLHSPIFGRALVSSGFAVDGGVLASDDEVALALAQAAQDYALRLSCSAIELRGPLDAPGWTAKTQSHCGFTMPLAKDDEAQLTAIPRKQRAEVRKGIANELQVTVGRSAEDLAAHFSVYSQSVRNLGTPVFPRSLFASVIDGLDADILTVWHSGAPVSSVLSLYHGEAVLPYWGGGTFAARQLRSNDRMYYALMCHARQRGCTIFDFGRSKTGSGPYLYKKTWGIEPQPLTYSSWAAPGCEARDADPTSAKHAARIAMWKQMPLGLANLVGPWIARGLG